MHPYGTSDDACDDFEKGDRPLSTPALLLELRTISREYLEEFHPQYDTFVVTGNSPDTFTQVALDIELTQKQRRVAKAFFRGISTEPRSIHIGAVKDISEWRSLKESGILKSWIEGWLEGEILARSEPVESNRPGGEEEFWQNIRSALAQCFPGSGEWSYRKRKSLPNDIYEFDTRSPSGELVRFNVSVNPTLPYELLLRELIGAIQQLSERTRDAGRYSFLFEDGLAETEDEEEWLYSRLRAVLRRCFPWADRWSIEDARMLFGGCSIECRTHKAHILIACRERTKERKLASLSREIEQQSERMRDRPQFRHLFEPPSGGRILPTGNYTPQNCRCIPESRERTS